MSYADIPQEMPAWFSRVNNFFINDLPRIQEFMNMQREIVARLIKLGDERDARIARLENALLNLDEWKRVCLSELRSEIALSVPRETSEQLIDNCEVRISNIPLNCNYLPSIIASRVLCSIGCGHLRSHVADARVWNVPPDARSSSIVFQLDSPIIRNKVMRHASRLRNLTSDILGCDGSDRLYMNQLLPKPLYILYRQACDRARELGYMRPFVRDLKIFMRSSRDSPLIPIRNESDLPISEGNIRLCKVESIKTPSSEAAVDTTAQVSNLSETRILNSQSTTINSTICGHTMPDESNAYKLTKRCKKKNRK